jgi:hypothetical protein
MLRIRTIGLAVTCVLAAGCGHPAPSANATSLSIPQADRTLESALTNVGVAVCQRQEPPAKAGQAPTLTLTLGPCDRGTSGSLEVTAYPSAAARSAGLETLAQPSLPWTQGWAWGNLAVVVNQKTSTDDVPALGNALRGLHASLVFLH